MRTIKFRMWSTTAKRFWFDDDNNVYTCLSYSKKDNMKQHLQDMVWQQFTGLLDNNGKEIYEGDIVKLKMHIENVKYCYKVSKNTLLPIIHEKIVDGDYCGVVRFDGDNGILSHFQYYVDLIPFYNLKNLTSNIEVIGNIFENSPNLSQETL